MGKNKNRLKAPQDDKGKRISPPPPVIDPDTLPPKFCLRRMRTGYSISDCVKDEKSAFADRLYQLSRQSWASLRQSGRHGQGWEIIDRMNIDGDTVPAEISADVDILAFRFFGKAPMVGYRSKDGVFNIVWLDRKFKLYAHG